MEFALTQRSLIALFAQSLSLLRLHRVDGWNYQVARSVAELEQDPEPCILHLVSASLMATSLPCSRCVVHQRRFYRGAKGGWSNRNHRLYLQPFKAPAAFCQLFFIRMRKQSLPWVPADQHFPLVCTIKQRPTQAATLGPLHCMALHHPTRKQHSSLQQREIKTNAHL